MVPREISILFYDHHGRRIPNLSVLMPETLRHPILTKPLAPFGVLSDVRMSPQTNVADCLSSTAYITIFGAQCVACLLCANQGRLRWQKQHGRTRVWDNRLEKKAEGILETFWGLESMESCLYAECIAKS